MLFLQSFYSICKRLAHHYHARTAAVLIIINLAIFIHCPFPQVVKLNGQQTLVARTFHYTMLKRAFQQIWLNTNDINMHKKIFNAGGQSNIIL